MKIIKFLLFSIYNLNILNFIFVNFIVLNIYFNSGRSCIKPNIDKNDPNNIFVVALVSGILSISNSFLLCLVPIMIRIRPKSTKIAPNSHGNIISKFKLFIIN